MTTPTITRTRGDTWQITMVINDTNPDTGVVAPYTGLATSAIVCTIRQEAGTLLWTGSKAGGQITVHPTIVGQITVEVPSATTEGVTRGRYVVDVEITTGAGRRFTPFLATISVLADVTRP